MKITLAAGTWQFWFMNKKTGDKLSKEGFVNVVAKTEVDFKTPDELKNNPDAVLQAKRMPS
jgi:hypothetical protein